MPNKSQTKLRKFIKNFYTSGCEGKLGIEPLQKIILLNILFSVGMPMLIYFSIIAMIKQNFWLAILEFIGTVLVIFCFFHMRRAGSYLLAGTIIALFMTFLFIILFTSGGIGNSGHLWSFSVPLFLLFIFGTKKGTWAIFTFLVLLFIFLSKPVQMFPQQKYNLDFLIRFVSSFIIVTCIAFLFEYIRTRTNQAIVEKNIELEKTVLEIKDKEKVLRESEKRFRELVDLLPQPVFEADLMGRVRYLSRSGYELSGYSKDDYRDDDFDALQMFIPEDQERLLENTKKILKRKKLGGIEYRIRRKDGSSLPVIIHSAPIVKDKRITGTRGVIIDITKLKHAEEEKKELEDKLVQSEKIKAVGELAGGVAHDLNNVLGAIVGYPDLLLMNLPSDSPLIKPVQTMKKSGQKAAAIVEDLLTLARRGVQVEEVLNLNFIIIEYLKSPEYEKLLSLHKNIEICTNLDPNLNNMQGSPIHLTKTLMNLVSNAAESMPRGGKINISTFNRYIDQPIRGYVGFIPEGEYIVFTISDQGVGIPASAIKKIFEPFYSKKVMGRSGTGLGMTVVLGTVIDHRGNLIIKSSKKKGTAFELYFPLVREKIVSKKIKFRIKDFKSDGKRILVVDDVEDQREIASALLKKLGYSVKTVSSGEEAIKYLLKDRVDLVILDMIMPPGIDGLETYKKMIKIQPGLKTIITSGYSETERVKGALKMGAAIYIRKPYTIDSIGIAIRNVLDEEKNKI